jgi:hypothetical protein
MKRLIDMAEQGVLPDWLIRIGIRMLDRKRLAEEARKEVEAGEKGSSGLSKTCVKVLLHCKWKSPRSSTMNFPRLFSRRFLENA